MIKIGWSESQLEKRREQMCNVVINALSVNALTPSGGETYLYRQYSNCDILVPFIYGTGTRNVNLMIIYDQLFDEIDNHKIVDSALIFNFSLLPA